MKPVSKLFIKFLLAGILNTSFGYLVFVLGVYFGLPNWLALLTSTILGVIFNFKTLSHLVFNSNGNSRFVIFLILYGTLYFLNLILLKIFVGVGLDSYVAGFLSIVLVIPISFAANKRFVFGYHVTR